MRKKLTQSLVMAVLIGCCNGGNIAAADEMLNFDLDQVIVTATRLEETFQKVPASVTVITEKQIQDRNATTITDVLKQTVGVFVDRPKGLADTSSGIEMRGFGEENILVLYDGMPMNTAYDGGVNWTAIPVDSVSRIEIIRGAASSLYGGRAVAGVINIITKEPGKDLKIKINALYGTNNTQRKGINLSQKLNDKFGYDISYENRSTGGFQNKAASSTSSGSTSATGTVGTGVVVTQKVNGAPRYVIGSPGDGAGESDTFRGKLKYDFTDSKSISYAYTHDKFKYWTEDPETYIHDINGNPLYTGSVQLPNGKWYNFKESDFTDYYGRRKTDIHSLTYNDKENDIIFTAGLTNVKDSGYSTGNYFDGSTSGSDTAYPSKSKRIDFQKAWRDMGKHTLVAGLNMQRDDMTRTNSTLSAWHNKNSVTGIKSIQSGKDENYAMFLQDTYAWTDALKIYAGARYDRYKKYDGHYDDFTNSKYVNYAEESYSEVSPKVSLEYSQNDNVSYYLSYGHSFNPPTLYKLYRTDSSYVGNPDLKPETSNTLEIGVKSKLDEKTNFGFSVYHAKTTDLITAENVVVGGQTKKWYNNIDKAKRVGAELAIAHQFDDAWSGYLNYTLQSIENGDGERIYSYPRNIAHAGLKYQKRSWDANFDLEYISNRNEPGEVSGVYLSYDGFCVANLGVNYKFAQNTKLSFNVDNLFDKNYYLWYKAAGRTYTVGLEYSF